MDSIIFDVDGTLWDSADSVAAAWNLAIKKFSSLDITLDREILGSVFGKTMTDIGDILFPSLSETEKDSLLSACCELENNYLKNHPGIIYEGVADTIEKLSKKIPSFYCQQLSMRIYRSNNAGNRYRTFHKRSSLFRRNGRF